MGERYSPKPEARNKVDNREVRDCLLNMECFCRPTHIAGDDGTPNGETEKEVAAVINLENNQSKPSNEKTTSVPLARQTYLSGIFSSPFVKSNDMVAPSCAGEAFRSTSGQ